MKKQILISGLLAMALVGLSGCVGKEGYFQSHECLTMDQTNNFILANDFIDFIGDYYNPSTTKFVIDPKNDFSHYLAVIESRLREKGYGVSYSSMNEAAWLAWKINKINEDTISVTYHVSQSKFTRFYKMQHGKYVPIGSFTVFNEPTRINTKPPVEIEPIVEKPKLEVKTIVVDEPTDVWGVFVQQNSYLHIREEPTIKSKILGTLKRGTTVATEINTAKKKGWAKLSKVDGYIATRYLKQVKTTSGDLVYGK